MGTRTAPWREQTCWIPRMLKQSAKPMRSPLAHAPSGPEVPDFTKGRIYGCIAGLLTSLEISLPNRGRPYTESIVATAKFWTPAFAGVTIFAFAVCALKSVEQKP